MHREYVGDLVSRCAVLAALLEVSAYPKPGNVHRTHDFPETKYEHFLAGSVAIEPAIRKLALQGYDVAEGYVCLEEIKLGDEILKAVTESLEWQNGGNVNLGIILLFAPLSVAGGYVFSRTNLFDIDLFKKQLKRVTSLGNPRDTALLYEAIRMAMTPKVLGSVDDFDVFDESVFNRIYDEKTTPIDIFKKCAKRDSICSEWVSNFKITLDMGYPYLKKSLNQTHDINLAIVSTFLYILSEIPDSLIIRKCGYEKALEVSKRVKSIIDLGGAFSELGFKMIRQLDLDLQSKGGNINPGTSADLTASSIFIALLEGWRP